MEIDRKEWEKADLFCPYCGEMAVIRQPGEGDYYVGPEHHCTACNSDFHLG